MLVQNTNVRIFQIWSELPSNISTMVNGDTKENIQYLWVLTVLKVGRVASCARIVYRAAVVYWNYESS